MVMFQHIVVHFKEPCGIPIGEHPPRPAPSSPAHAALRARPVPQDSSPARTAVPCAVLAGPARPPHKHAATILEKAQKPVTAQTLQARPAFPEASQEGLFPAVPIA